MQNGEAGKWSWSAKMSFTSFRKIVWTHYQKHGRHTLPWRKTRDPYKILVSEIMLQQTQVERVLPFYAEFMKRFPTARKLAAAPLSDVLRMWQGLGYNRRAKMLKEAAARLHTSALARHHAPELIHEFEQLPGVGPYTARAIVVFAFNQDVIFVETNIRTAIIHHFFRRRDSVEDTELVEVLQRILPKGRARKWYWALMDYGAALKKQGIKLNNKSAHYTKQSRFAGSLREARGVILRELARGPLGRARLTLLFGPSRSTQLNTALNDLEHDGLITKRGRSFRLAG